MSSNSSTINLSIEQNQEIKRHRLRGPSLGITGQGVYKAPRNALQPGAVTRREWLRFLRYVSIGDECACTPGILHRHWIWTGSKTKQDYGHFCWRGRIYGAYRFAVIAMGKSIPSGFEPDHLCRIHACVNPICLEVVTKRENIHRGEGIFRKNARKTHCPQGHPLKGNNLYLPDLENDIRRCRTCREAQIQQREERRKALLAVRPLKPPRTHCNNGHALTDDNVLPYELRVLGQRICRICVRVNERSRRAHRVS